MLGDGPSKKKKQQQRVNKSRTTPGAALKIVKKHSFKHIVRKMRSSESSYWLDATVQLCGLLSADGPWVEKVFEKRLFHRLLYFLTVKDQELQVEAGKALKYVALSTTSEVVHASISDQAMNSAYGPLWYLLHSENDMVLSHVCCSLAVLSGCSVEFGELVLNPGLYIRIFELTRYPTLEFVALRALGNLLLIDARFLSKFHSMGGVVLADLKKFLSHRNVDVRKEACWVISYIAAGTWSSSMQAGFFDVLIGPLVTAMKKDEFAVLEAAVWAISNATFGATSAQIEVMVKEGCIDILCELLCSRDIEIFEACLDGLENILKVGEKCKRAGVNPYVKHMERIEGWAVLKAACGFYQKEKLYKRSLKLMVKYRYMSRRSYERCMRPGRGRFGSDAAKMKGVCVWR